LIQEIWKGKSKEPKEYNISPNYDTAYVKRYGTVNGKSKETVMTPLSQITDEMRLIFNKYYKDDDREGIEQMFDEFRQQNVNPILVTMLLVEELNITLSEANRMVGSSKAWNA